MTRKIERRFARNVLAVSIAAIGMNAAWADEGEEEVRRLVRPDSEIEIGVGHLSSDGNNKFGDFTGLDHSGSNLIGNVRVTRRERYSHVYSRPLRSNVLPLAPFEFVRNTPTFLPGS